MAAITIQKAEKAQKGSLRGTVYLCFKGSTYVGMIQKIANTRTDIHPWKVFKSRGGLGTPLDMVATFYDDADSVKIGPAFDYETCKIGGKAAAFTYARAHL